jgi:RNA polymerase sigma factor (sigma-70 family)
MVNDNKVNEFNQFYKKNYNYLVSFSKSIDPRNDYESLAHDAYIRCQDRILSNGYEGENFLNYTRVAIMNLYKSNYRKNKKLSKVDIEDPAFFSYIEDILQGKEDQQIRDDEKYHRDIYLTTMVYEYLEKYCLPKEVFIFKTYYLLKHRHLNYKQLAEATNYSLTTVSNVIKKVKKQLRYNIKSYIISGLSMEELLEEVRILLTTKNISQYWSEYVAMYLKITGTKWNGCHCKSQKLWNTINDWYQNNNKKQ